MRPEELMALLGCPATDPLVEQALAHFRIRRRPQLEWDEDDVDGPVVETRDWLINRRLGIEFGFEDEAAFLGREAGEYGLGPMLLTQLYFYCDHEGVNPYRGTLPFGLQCGDSRDSARVRLSTWEATRRSYVRDTWELEGATAIISYVDDGRRIGFVLCTLPRPPKPPADDGPAQLPATDEMLAVLGAPWRDARLQTLFAPLHMERYLEEQGETRIVNLRETCGLELRFEPEGGRSEQLVFTGVRFYRDRELDARGWPGALPLDLEFNDSPEVMLQRISRPPDHRFDEMFEGHATWHLTESAVHVTYSTMFNWIVNVHVMARGALAGT